MRSQANSHRQNRTFQEGDWVWLRLQPYRQATVRGRTSPKFAKRFFGPYRITKKLGPIAFKLALPPDARIHPVLHISKFKPFHGEPPVQIPPLATTITSTRIKLQPTQVLGSRILKKPTGTLKQLLIQWDGLFELEATWEDAREFLDTYPNVALEDKGRSGPGE